jgi:hypothetical protein
MTDNDNGHEDEKQEVRHCPFLKECCIEKKCALYIEMKRIVGGLHQTFGMCSFVATVQMMSEMNMKAQQPQQKIQIPNLMRSQHGN